MDIGVLLGKKVRQARLLAELSQEDLGKQIGLKQSAMSALERGDRATSVQELQRIADYFHKPIIWFLVDGEITTVDKAREETSTAKREALDDLLSELLEIRKKYASG